MNQRNRETVERTIQLLNDEGPREAFAQGLVAPDAVWHPAAEFDSADYVGADGFAGFMQVWTEQFQDWSIALTGIRGTGDRVVAFTRQEATGNVSGIDVRMDFAMLFTLKDGCIVETHTFLDAQEALTAAGL